MELRSRIFLFLLLLHSSAFAQTAQRPDTSVYYVNYAATGFINRTTDGNSYLINNALKFGFDKRNVESNLSAGWIYGRQESGLTNNDLTAVADVNLLKGVKKFYYWGLLTYDKSYSLKIDNRMQVGAGLGYIVLGLERINLVLSDGPLYEATRLYDTTSYQTVRNSFRIKYRIAIGETIVVDGSNFLQNSFLQASDYIIKMNNNLSLKFNQWLSLTAATTYNKINVSKKENFLCNFGFRIERYF